MNVLEIEDLRILLRSGDSEVALVDGVSLTVAPGSVVGLAGESGSGKTLTGLSAMGFLPDRSRATGAVRFAGQDVLKMNTSRSAADARPPGRRRVPGSDDVAAPDAQRRTSTHRARRGPPRAVCGTSARAGDRAAQVGAPPRPRARPVELSAPVLRGDAPAHRHRQRARLRTPAADRRRADDGPRRDRPGGHPAAASTSSAATATWPCC